MPEQQKVAQGSVMSKNSLILVLQNKKENSTIDMAKIQIKFEKLTPFVGIYYASKAFYAFYALSLDKVINGTLGVRGSIVKKFVFHFTAVCAKWTRTARNWWLNLHTGMPYDKLSFG